MFCPKCLPVAILIRPIWADWIDLGEQYCAYGDAKVRSADVLGARLSICGEFALAEGKGRSILYTPRSVVELLVEMLEPYQGRVFDPCCGSGGHVRAIGKIWPNTRAKSMIFPFTGRRATHDLAPGKDEPAIRGIDSSQVKWNNEGSFLNDAHKDLKADVVIANPPFNDSDWSGDLLRGGGRWKYGVPPSGNANYARIQHSLPFEGYVDVTNTRFVDESVVKSLGERTLKSGDFLIAMTGRNR